MSHFPGSPEKTRESLLPKVALKPWVRSSPPGFILRNARVIDPAQSRILPGYQDVVIKDGLIASLNPSPSTLDEPHLAAVDLGGKFLCPGLIDCHVHVTAIPGVKSMGELSQTPLELVHLRSTYVLREMLLRGFTTVRDTGGASKALASAIAEGLIPGPRLFQCGKALSQTGGHADFTASGSTDAGCCGGHSHSLGRTCDGVPEVLKAARDALKGGADFIKIMCGGGVASPTDSIESVQFTVEEIRAITTTCAQMGNVHTTAHAYTDAAVRHAIDNGVKGIEHGNLISRDTAELMASKGVFLTPTLSCYGIMVRPPWEDFLPPDGKVKNEQVMARGLDALKIADDAGVIICYGSDLLTSMHALQTEEFTVRSSVLPSARVLKHATTNAAIMLGDPKLGKIAAGCYADLLVLDASPLDDVTVLDYPEDHLFAVIQGGHVVCSRLGGLAASSQA
ncbi:hypothetical protein L226DRAFT_554267 [Lentinus tigrinus ALCF2SS1-7]|uniref:Amidohydrolase-related domain-containing protein n=1 Tax=Lentinus tigrinus ALCF2SS1-6 TaxID=1328759 RepID=A0A5C2S2N5_9APHY|nr:hypothetical protein L227DRAFT_529935 [Lentinus tigrinus ALCF2SS1-6]RPD71892.1 hypothetical protein L226DRAFT_554267 [Lentinus tigrinus ALCF2SS1-7]